MIVGLRRDDGRWLLIRRSEHVAAPLKVAFPGGAIEPGEDQRTCAVREVREELGIDIEPGEQVWRHDFDDKPLTLWGYSGRIANGRAIEPKPNAHEVVEVLWLTPAEIAAHPDALPKSDRFAAALEAAHAAL